MALASLSRFLQLTKLVGGCDFTPARVSRRFLPWSISLPREARKENCWTSPDLLEEWPVEKDVHVPLKVFPVCESGHPRHQDRYFWVEMGSSSVRTQCNYHWTCTSFSRACVGVQLCTVAAFLHFRNIGSHSKLAVCKCKRLVCCGVLFECQDLSDVDLFVVLLWPCVAASIFLYRNVTAW